MRKLKLFGKKNKAPKAPKIKKPKRKILHSLAFKLVAALMILLGIFFTALVFILNYSIGKDSLKSYTELSTTISERSVAALSYWFEGYFKDLRVLTRSDAFLDGDVIGTRDFIMENQQLISDDFEFVAIAGINGIAYSSDEQEFSCSHTSYFKEIIEKGEGSFVTNPERSFKSDSPLFYIALPATDRNGRLFGLIIGALPVDYVQYEVDKITDNIDGYAFILDGNCTTIAHPDPERIMENLAHVGDENTGLIGYTELCEEIMMENSGCMKIVDTNAKQTNYVFYSPISGTKWSFGLSIPEDSVLASAKKSRYSIEICCAVIVVLLIIFIAIYMGIMLKPLLLLNDSIAEIAKGDADLTKRLDIKSKDEIGGVVQGFNLFIENLRNIISQIKTSKAALQSVDEEMQSTTQTTASSITQISSNIINVTDQINSQTQNVSSTVSAVTQIAKNIENLNGMIENQSNGVNQASSAIEEMLGNIISVSKSTEHMANAFNQLQDFTKTGIEKQDIVNQQLAAIEEQSKALFNANKTISKIAGETNLLAMNAAIEAAHAGEAGRGFSVVADEIRNLSETSARQSKTIGAELKKIQESITTVVASSNDAKQAFNSVSSNIQETDQLVRQIKAAMEESEVGSHQITDALKIMNDATSEVRTSSQEMSSGNQAILSSVQQLQDSTIAMKTSMERIGSDAKLIDQNGATLGEISNTMNDSILQIGQQIDLFKV